MSLKTLQTGTVVPIARVPTAAFTSNPEFGVLGSIVKLDGRQSLDPDGKDLTYSWSFVSAPIGSKVSQEGFRTVDPDGSLVSFSPDVVGEYVVGLTVSNGTLSSSLVSKSVSIRAILVPHARGIVPDGKFIWSYIRDVWTQVDGFEFFESLWSALIQIVGAELIKVYQVDFNKSIKDIQDQFQRRWLSYEPKLKLQKDDISFFLGNHEAGTNAMTGPINLGGLGVILSASEIVMVQGAITPLVKQLKVLQSKNSANIQTYDVSNLNSAKTGYNLSSTDQVPFPVADRIFTDIGFFFSINSKDWTVSSGSATDYGLAFSMSGSPLDQYLGLFATQSGVDVSQIQVGDVIHYPAGPNAGFYIITAKSGGNFTVHKAPNSFSNLTTSLTYKANVYRPVRIDTVLQEQLVTDTIAVPYSSTSAIPNLTAGRVVIVNGKAYTILRTGTDLNQRVPLSTITVDREVVPAELQGLNWRVPHTLVSESQNFEDLGVSPGDLLLADIYWIDANTTVEVRAQVVGVDRNRLGFVLSDQPLKAGMIPDITDETYLSLSSGFGIDSVAYNASSQLVISGVADSLLDELNSVSFADEYWNSELTPDSEIKVKKLAFKLVPKTIIRNRLVPVDSTLQSVPMLQEFIVPPAISKRDGKIYQLFQGQEYELKREPSILKENSEYIVDGNYAINGTLLFKPGSSEVIAEDGDFIDRCIGPGDSFIIDAPLSLAGTYIVQSVVSRTKLKLTKAIPSYILDGIIPVQVRIKRNRTGHFLRFAPGLYSAANPAPDRLWGEVSFFDNSDNIENNFGILVGLKKEDLDNVSSDISYRQAVAGLMYAFTRGSALDKVRLGTQILLGLPFAEHRGIIRSIEPDYRLNSSGDPIQGRILVEDVSPENEPQGTLRLYTYPIDPESDLAGLEINSATNAEYAVGDIVELFTPLSKGVAVEDYITSPLSDASTGQAKLQQFHSIRVRVNDNIFTLAELNLVSSFLKKITPAYIASFLSIASDFDDTVSVQEKMQFTLAMPNNLVDQASFGIPPVLMLNSKDANLNQQITMDGSVYWVRRIGYDLSVNSLGSVFTTAAGGLLNPKTGESFESPLTRAGDIVLIDGGPNQGKWTIASIPSDTTFTLSGGPSAGWTQDSGRRFLVMRKLSSVLRTDSGTFISGVPFITVATGGLRVDGVAPGDQVRVAQSGVVNPFTILSVSEGTPGSGEWDTLQISPNPTFSGAASLEIYRPSLVEGNDTTVFRIVVFSGTITCSDPFFYQKLENGDELIDTTSATRTLILDSKKIYGVPVLSDGSYIVTICKPKRPKSTFGIGHQKFYDPFDRIELTLIDPTTTASINSATGEVTFSADLASLGVRPGDLIKFTSGTAASLTDYGHGTGTTCIKSFVTSTKILTTSSFSATESVSWKIIRRR